MERMDLTPEAEQRMDLTPEVEQRLAEDYTAWLTTVTDKGLPAPNPVWFVKDESDQITVFTHRNSRKVHNIEQRPTVCFHFNPNRLGRKSLIIVGDVNITHDEAPSTVPGYLEKYWWSINEEMGMAVDDFNRKLTTRLRIQPTHVRHLPEGLAPDGVPPWFA